MAMNDLIEKLPLVVVWFAAFSMRIVVMPEAWTFYVPVVSPVYGSAAHWLSTPQRTHAIFAHVLSGVVTVACGIAQLDKPLRRARPGLHRWSGRLYMVSGLVMVLTLRPLRETSGGFARPGDGASPAMALFIDATTVAWFASALLAVFYAAVQRDFISHRRWAVANFAVVLTPLAQRISLMLIVPAAIAFRLMRDALVHGMPFWNSAWGVAPQAWSGPPSAPKVLSLEGYGVAENMVFPYSAWLGFALVTAACFLAAWTSQCPRAAAAVDADVIGADESGNGSLKEGASSWRSSSGASADNLLWELSVAQAVTEVMEKLSRAVPGLSRLVQLLRRFAAWPRSRGALWATGALLLPAGYAGIVTNAVVTAAVIFVWKAAFLAVPALLSLSLLLVRLVLDGNLVGTLEAGVAYLQDHFHL